VSAANQTNLSDTAFFDLATCFVPARGIERSSTGQADEVTSWWAEVPLNSYMIQKTPPSIAPMKRARKVSCCLQVGRALRSMGLLVSTDSPAGTSTWCSLGSGAIDSCSVSIGQRSVIDKLNVVNASIHCIVVRGVALQNLLPAHHACQACGARQTFK